MENGHKIRKIESFCILICAYNEAEAIQSVVRSCLAQKPAKVIVVDDGSVDDTARLAELAGATVLGCADNRGKGSALRTGFGYLLEHPCDAVVVVDADGQHDPCEIQCFIDAYERTHIPILVGNRMADTTGMPWTRQWTNRFMAWVLNRLVKIYIADPPCGYRFYRSDVLPIIMSDENRFAFEFDVLVRAALRRIRIDSVRISTIYNHKCRSHVAPLRDALLFFGVVKHHFLVTRNEQKAELLNRDASG